jgi:hypothetical protein
MKVPMNRRRAAAAIFVVALASAAATAAAQDKPTSAPVDEQEGARALFRGIALDTKELGQIEKVLAEDEETLAKAKAEIRILQARLARLMLEKTVPMDQVKSLVKESLDWEYQIRLIQIARHVAIRRILGDDRWASILKLGRAVPALERGGKPPADARESERRNRLLSILKRLN